MEHEGRKSGPAYYYGEKILRLVGLQFVSFFADFFA
jgi:hypothetical protein